MCPRETETDAMPELEELVVRTLRGEPVPGSVLVERFAQTYGDAQVRSAIWRLVDRGRVELTWNSRLRAMG
jgi:hypothetical protein